jgi:hypothetical protein
MSSKLKLYNAVPEFDPGSRIREGVEKTYRSLIDGLPQSEWKSFQGRSLFDVAKDTNEDMVGWYNRVYRVACEPAHIADLSEYLPPARGAVTIAAPVKPATFRSLIALDFGLQIIFDLLRNISTVFELPLPEVTTRLKTEFYKVHGRPVNPTI